MMREATAKQPDTVWLLAHCSMQPSALIRTRATTSNRFCARCSIRSRAGGRALVGDAFDATYFLLRALLVRNIDAMFEQDGSRNRITDF